MFASLRLVVAGAEKLSPQVLEGFKLKFHKTILEGYGTTELSPVSGTNLPNEIDDIDMHVQHSHKVGTVGLPFTVRFIRLLIQKQVRIYRLVKTV